MQSPGIFYLMGDAMLRFWKKIKYTVKGRMYCYLCLTEPGAGFSKDGMDFCFPCWDRISIDGVLPKPDNRWFQLLGEVAGLMREVRQRMTHLHEWELVDLEVPWSHDVTVYSCFNCLGVLPEDTRWAWKWNPLVEWH